MFNRLNCVVVALCFMKTGLGKSLQTSRALSDVPRHQQIRLGIEKASLNEFYIPVDEIRNREGYGLSNLIDNNIVNSQYCNINTPQNTNFSHNNSASGVGSFGADSQGPSLLRLLLKVEGLQSELISYLIERIAEFVYGAGKVNSHL